MKLSEPILKLRQFLFENGISCEVQIKVKNITELNLIKKQIERECSLDLYKFNDYEEVKFFGIKFTV
jgi:hypothetical protein